MQRKLQTSQCCIHARRPASRISRSDPVLGQSTPTSKPIAESTAATRNNVFTTNRVLAAVRHPSEAAQRRRVQWSNDAREEQRQSPSSSNSSRCPVTRVHQEFRSKHRSDPHLPGCAVIAIAKHRWLKAESRERWVMSVLFRKINSGTSCDVVGKLMEQFK
jgi:hypothetical protein